MTKRYTIVLQETVVGEFEVKASSPEEAFMKAKNNYHAGFMVNEPGECQDVQVSVLDDNKNMLINLRGI